MSDIQGADIYFSYDAQARYALDGLGIAVAKGEMIAILGENGSGKSTLARHFNALLPLQNGALCVAGIDVRDQNELWRLRRHCGMVFQNPDNQFVSTIIEEDAAFGLENYEVAREEIPGKVASALKLAGMEGYEQRSPFSLSGGQKQRVALAGVLALDPDIIIFDEVTAMLDPQSRREIVQIIKKIHIESKKTVIMITHITEEAICADRVFLMRKGTIIASGSPREVLTDITLMQSAALVPPVPVRIYHDLLEAGIQLQCCPLTNEELAEELCRLL